MIAVTESASALEIEGIANIPNNFHAGLDTKTKYTLSMKVVLLINKDIFHTNLNLKVRLENYSNLL